MEAEREHPSDGSDAAERDAGPDGFRSASSSDDAPNAPLAAEAEWFDADVVRVDPGPAPYTVTDVVAGSIALLFLEATVVYVLTVTVNNALFTAAAVALTAALALVAVRIALARRFRAARRARRAARDTFRRLKQGECDIPAEEIVRAILVRRASGRSMTPRVVRRDIETVEDKYGVPLPRVWIIAPPGAVLPEPAPPELRRRPPDAKDDEHAQPAQFEPFETRSPEQDWPSLAVFVGLVAAAAVAYGVAQTGAPAFLKVAAVAIAALIFALVGVLAMLAKPRFLYAILSTPERARIAFTLGDTPTAKADAALDHQTPVLIHARWRRDGSGRYVAARGSLRWRFLLRPGALLPTISAPGFDPEHSPWRHAPRSSAWRCASASHAYDHATPNRTPSAAITATASSDVPSTPQRLPTGRHQSASHAGPTDS